MAVTVQLPPGCSGLDAADGTRYSARPGGTVRVEDDHARDIRRGEYGQKGLIDARGLTSLGTKTGRECEPCHRVWQAWSETCPKCGAPTTVWPA